jgi:hypothetical protein
MVDPDLIQLTMQMARKRGALKVSYPTRHPRPPAKVEGPPPAAAATNPGLHPQQAVKETKTADELAAMILTDLSEVEGCPKEE